MVLVAGEAGVGKSALVEQLQTDLPDARWSWGACDGLFTLRPLGPLLDLAGQLGGELESLGLRADRRRSGHQPGPVPLVEHTLARFGQETGSMLVADVLRDE